MIVHKEQESKHIGIGTSVLRVVEPMREMTLIELIGAFALLFIRVKITNREQK